jgi:Stage II sporulation protein E (SpoIIE)
MPLGLMPHMVYEEHDTRLAPGDTLLLHSDGLAEAHNKIVRCSASHGCDTWCRSIERVRR